MISEKHASEVEELVQLYSDLRYAYGCIEDMKTFKALRPETRGLLLNVLNKSCLQVEGLLQKRGIPVSMLVFDKIMKVFHLPDDWMPTPDTI